MYFNFRYATLLLLTYFPFLLLKSQGVHPQNLFDTGLNMGYLTGHYDKSTDQVEATIWAGNASAEWLSSWLPGTVSPITPELNNPYQAHNTMVSTITQMTGCAEAYFNLRLSFYRLGFSLGRSVVETGYNCSNCLRSELQKASIEMRTIGQLLTSEVWQDMSRELNTVAQGVNVSLIEDRALQQNNGQFGYLQSVLNRVNELLEDELILCEGTKLPPKDRPRPPKNESQSTSNKKRKNRNMYITFGYTGATLEGDDGSQSQPGDGFYGGFDLAFGKPVFLLLGVDFFRNSAGKEYFIPSISQISGPGEYIQGFRIHLGLGANVIERQDFKLSVFGNIRLLTATAIDGDLLSLGDALLEDNPLDLNLGTYISYGLFTLHTSYDLGMTPVLSVGDVDMKYRMWNLGLGIQF